MKNLNSTSDASFLIACSHSIAKKRRITKQNAKKKKKKADQATKLAIAHNAHNAFVNG